jgi:hypothetical protein
VGGFIDSIKSLGQNLMTQNIAGTARGARAQAVNASKQQVQMEQQQADQLQQQADLNFAEHMNSIGALPIYPGSNAVRDPGQPVSGPIADAMGMDRQFPTTRAADPSRIVKHKTLQGDTVQWEIPTPEQQQQIQLHRALTQARGMQPVADINAQQAGQEAQARAAGTAAGQSQGKQSDLDARGIAIDADFAKKMNLPDAAVGMKMLPEQIEQMSQRVTPAQIRGDASTANTNTRVGGQKDVAQMRIDATQALQDQKDQAASDRDQNKLDYQNRWQAARNAITSNTQSSLNNRLGLRMFDLNQQQHGKLQDQIYKEGQRQLDAQALVNEAPTSSMFGGNGTEPVVKDGEEFTDPWSGKKATMNYAQRLRIKNAIGKSQQQVSDWQNRAQQIEQRYGLTGQQSPAAGGPAGGAQPGAAQPSVGSAAPAAAPASTQPRGANSGGSAAKVVTKAQVAAAAQKLGVDVATATQRYQKMGYKIQ